MTYLTMVQVKRGASSERLHALQRSLSAFDCIVLLDRPFRRLLLELPTDDYQWIVTGGLAELLERFEDCVAWRPHFREGRHVTSAPPLPPPGVGEA